MTPDKTYSLNAYLKSKYGKRVQKITVDGDFTCPNRDGKIGTGGCIYCNNEAFNPQLRKVKKNIKDQLKEGIEFSKRRYNADLFIAYFQPYTNTYASVGELKLKYDCIKNFPEIIGLSVGTRPDCIDNGKLDLLAGYMDSYEVWVEYGLQSARNKTLAFINRGHDFSEFKNAVIKTKEKGIKVCAHVIIGIPGESEKDYIFTAQKIAELNLDGIKIHPLHIIKDTKLYDIYKTEKFTLLKFEEYIKFAVDMIEILPASCIIHRVGASAWHDLLIAPEWIKEKKDFFLAVNKELEKRNSRQGLKFKN